MANTYITKEELRIDPYNIDHQEIDDKYLETLQEVTYSLVNKFCNQTFEMEGTEESPVSEKVNGTGKATIFLPKKLITLSSIRIYFDLTQYDEYEAVNFVAKDKYIEWNVLTDVSARIIGQTTLFPKGTANVEVVGIWGWENVPEPIKYLQGKLIEKLIEDKSFAQKFEAERVGDYQYQIRRKTERQEEITGDFELDLIIKQYRNWLAYGSF